MVTLLIFFHVNEKKIVYLKNNNGGLFLPNRTNKPDPSRPKQGERVQVGL